VAKKGAICPIFEGDMPPKKIYPQNWPLYDGHSMKAVKVLKGDEGCDKINQASTARRLKLRASNRPSSMSTTTLQVEILDSHAITNILSI
jgi:hypothetical protein